MEWCKRVSCGVIYQVGYKVLAIHPTKADHWSVPKGVLEDGETPLIAAIRELEEETGIAVPKGEYKKFIDLGRFKYLKGKDLHLFFYDGTNTFPGIEYLNCKILAGEGFPEVDNFELIPYDLLIKRSNYRLSSVLSMMDSGN